MAMAMSSTAGSGLPVGYEQDMGGQQLPTRPPQGGGYSSTSAISQLFARLSQEIEEKQPKNCIHFVVDFLCKHYPEHLHGFASIWQMDPDLERERHEVVNFFKAHKISTAVAAHFTNAGYDTLDTLTTLSPDSLVDVEAFNNVKWLPGHKVRLQQIFGEISARVRAYRQQYEQSQSQSQSSPAHHRQHSPPQHHRHSPHHTAGHSQSHGHSHAASHAPTVRHAAPAATLSASPYLASPAAMAAHPAMSAAAYTGGIGQPTALHGASPALASPYTTALGASGLGAGIGHGIAAPALPAAGGLFHNYGASPYA